MQNQPARYQIVYGRAPFAHLDPMQRMFALLDMNNNNNDNNGVYIIYDNYIYIMIMLDSIYAYI